MGLDCWDAPAQVLLKDTLVVSPHLECLVHSYPALQRVVQIDICCRLVVPHKGSPAYQVLGDVTKLLGPSPLETLWNILLPIWEVYGSHYRQKAIHDDSNEHGHLNMVLNVLE